MTARSLSAFLAVVLVGLTFCSSARATTRADLVAGLGTLPLMIDKISGDIKMAVIYDPSNPASKADADAVMGFVEAGIEAPGGGKVTALLVSISDLSKLSRVKVALLTMGLEAHYADINVVASAASVLTITTDINCVKTRNCIVGVATSPNVAIYFSKAAADAAKIEFSQSFAMLVREL